MSATPTARPSRVGHVSVTGGELTVGRWDAPTAESPAVLAIHGITASHRSFAPVAERLPGVAIHAPDLRGRGRSNALPGPFGLGRHVDDLLAILDAERIEQACVIGHSMGAFVAVLLAARAPDRVSDLILIDGGVPLRLPANVTREAISLDVLGPAAARLSMTFADHGAYRDFWRAHPAFGPYWNDAIEDYVDYDLDGVAPALRPASNPAAVSADVAELYGGPGYERALGAVTCPATVLRAPRGLLDGDALYPDPSVLRDALPGAHLVDVPDTNHYTVLLGTPGADAIAAAYAARGRITVPSGDSAADSPNAGRSSARQGGHS
ncbi:MAG: alpha/beta fold hydrolase [Microcella sp.]